MAFFGFSLLGNDLPVCIYIYMCVYIYIYIFFVNLQLVSEELEVYLGTSYNELYVQCPDGSYTSCYIYRLRLRIPAEGFREGPFCT